MVCTLSGQSMQVGLVSRSGDIRRVGRWYFFTLLTYYYSSDGKAEQGNGWMDEARVGLAVSECIRRGSHDGMDIGSMVGLGRGAGTRWELVKLWYLVSWEFSYTLTGNHSRQLYQSSQTKQKHPFPLPVTFFSPGLLQIIAMHTWPSPLEKNGKRRKEG